MARSGQARYQALFPAPVLAIREKPGEPMATVFKVERALWLTDLVPRRVRPHHRIQDREQLAHTGDECDLLGLASRDEAKVEGANNRVASGRDKRAHVEHGADRRAASPEDSLASEGAAVIEAYRMLVAPALLKDVLNEPTASGDGRPEASAPGAPAVTPLERAMASPPGPDPR